MLKYYPRIIDRTIAEKLQYTGAIFIRGPKWCGKSTSARQIAKSQVLLGDASDSTNYLELAKMAPSIILKGTTPRLIDEWQLAPQLWNTIKTEIDRRNLPNQFILTGSATPVDDDSHHPGTGRIARIDMYPMSLYESQESSGKISLANFLKNTNINIDGIESSLTIDDYAYLICRGGWPSTLSLKRELAVKVAKDYLLSLTEDDIARTARLPHNPRLTRLLLRSYARNIATIDSYKSIFNDVKSQYSDVSDSLLYQYLNALERLFIIDEIEAWNPNLRSKNVIRSAKKKHLIDPSLAAASLDASPESLLLDVKTMGLMFESLVARDLKIYATSNGGYVNHYRDAYGLECDTVLHFDNGKYLLIEIKLGDHHVEMAAKNLLRLNSLIKEKNMTAPSALIIITGTKLAYRRDDGIYVVPLGCLKP